MRQSWLLFFTRFFVFIILFVPYYLQIFKFSICNLVASVESCVAVWSVCCSVLQCVAVCCSVLQCVAVSCSVLQWVAVCAGVHRLERSSHKSALSSFFFYIKWWQSWLFFCIIFLFSLFFLSLIICFPPWFHVSNDDRAEFWEEKKCWLFNLAACDVSKVCCIMVVCSKFSSNGCM